MREKTFQKRKRLIGLWDIGKRQQYLRGTEIFGAKHLARKNNLIENTHLVFNTSTGKVTNDVTILDKTRPDTILEASFFNNPLSVKNALTCKS